MTSTLFGHRRARSPARSPTPSARSQEAEGGTLFLDEVGDLGAGRRRRGCCASSTTRPTSGSARPRERPRRRPPRRRDQPAASRTRCAAGRFREDLFFRLNVVTLTLPPLRERRRGHRCRSRAITCVLRRRRQRARRSASPRRPARRSRAYDWPGNLRELRNAVERAAILAPTAVLIEADFGITAHRPRPRAQAIGAGRARRRRLPRGVEREHIARVMARAPRRSRPPRGRSASTRRRSSANASATASPDRRTG